MVTEESLSPPPLPIPWSRLHIPRGLRWCGQLALSATELCVPWLQKGEGKRKEKSYSPQGPTHFHSYPVFSLPFLLLSFLLGSWQRQYNWIPKGNAFKSPSVAALSAWLWKASPRVSGTRKRGASPPQTGA